MNFLMVILIIFLIAVFFILSDITIHAGFHRSRSIQKTETVIYLMKRIKIFQKKMVSHSEDKVEEAELKKAVADKVEKITEVVFKSFDTIKIYHQLLDDINDKLKKGLKTEKLALCTRIGTGDAAATGLLCGMIWTVFGNFRMQKEYYKFFKDMNFFVEPDFKRKFFKIDIDCIFTIKTVYIIYVIRSIKRIFEIEEARTKAS